MKTIGYRPGKTHGIPETGGKPAPLGEPGLHTGDLHVSPDGARIALLANGKLLVDARRHLVPDPLFVDGRDGRDARRHLVLDPLFVDGRDAVGCLSVQL